MASRIFTNAVLAGVQAAKKKADEANKKVLGVNPKETGMPTASSSGGSTGGTTNKNSQFTGSSNAIVTNNNTQKAIKNKMNTNSQPHQQRF